MLEERNEILDFRQLAEGLDSQAFGFRRGATDYVVRINRSSVGFEKDAFVHRCFASPTLPIPQILDIGRLDEDHAFCISLRARGVGVHDLDAADLLRIVAPTADVMVAISGSDLAGTTGFGPFDSTGTGSSASWKAFLTSIADPQRYDWAAASRSADMKMVEQACRVIEGLAEHCPERRCLIHGDFGSYNLLTDGRNITAVIDWDRALFGDPLYEVANLIFWHEQCLERLIRELEAASDDMPGWRQRSSCYQLRIGLQEVYESALGKTPVDLKWLTSRCSKLLSSFPRKRGSRHLL